MAARNELASELAFSLHNVPRIPSVRSLGRHHGRVFTHDLIILAVFDNQSDALSCFLVRVELDRTQPLAQPHNSQDAY